MHGVNIFLFSFVVQILSLVCFECMFFAVLAIINNSLINKTIFHLAFIIPS